MPFQGAPLSGYESVVTNRAVINSTPESNVYRSYDIGFYDFQGTVQDAYYTQPDTTDRFVLNSQAETQFTRSYDMGMGYQLQPVQGEEEFTRSYSIGFPYQLQTVTPVYWAESVITPRMVISSAKSNSYDSIEGVFRVVNIQTEADENRGFDIGVPDFTVQNERNENRGFNIGIPYQLQSVQQSSPYESTQIQIRLVNITRYPIYVDTDEDFIGVGGSS